MSMPRAHELALLDSERKKLEEERERKKLEAEAKAAASSWLGKERGGVRRRGARESRALRFRSTGCRVDGDTGDLWTSSLVVVRRSVCMLICCTV